MTLSKPQNPQCCDNPLLMKFINPERWVCVNCDTVAAEVPKETAPTDESKCRVCGILKSSGVTFINGKNFCINCSKERVSRWNDEQRARLKVIEQSLTVEPTSAELNAKRDRLMQLVQKSPDSFCKYVAKRDGIEFSEIWDCYVRQGGKCAVTKLEMVYKMNDPLSISWFGGQLVCHWVAILLPIFNADQILHLCVELRR